MHIHRAFLAAAAATVANSEIFKVDVGKSGMTFEPETINPKKGDTVVFTLYSHHNVASGPFDTPCKYDSNSWFSGPFDQTDNGKKKYVVKVTTDQPVYYYCAVQGHCQGGMVGAWNPPASGDTIDAYASAAEDVDKPTYPSSIEGGVLMDDDQVASLSSSSPSAAPSGGASSAKAIPVSQATSANAIPVSEAISAGPKSAVEAPSAGPESTAEATAAVPESTAEATAEVPESTAEATAEVPESTAEATAAIPESTAEATSIGSGGSGFSNASVTEASPVPTTAPFAGDADSLSTGRAMGLLFAVIGVGALLL